MKPSDIKPDVMYSGLSTGGINVYGDNPSIKRVTRWMHDAEVVLPAVRHRLDEMVLQATPKLIGLSLSLCIKDVIDGKVRENQIAGLVSSTMFRDENEWTHGLIGYTKDYWSAHPMWANNVVERLRAANMIEQPRCQGRPVPDLGFGRWIMVLP